MRSCLLVGTFAFIPGTINVHYLHTFVDLYSPIIVIVQLFVDVPQRLQTEAVSLTYAWWHHDKTGVYRRQKKKQWGWR